MTFTTRIEVRTYELDPLGHLNHAVYHQYAEVARGDAFEAAGCRWDTLFDARTAPVMLATTASFHRELRKGDVVDVSCAAKFGSGKTFHIIQNITKPDGTTAAEITCTMGLMDLDARRLVPDPASVLAAAGTDLSALDPSHS